MVGTPRRYSMRPSLGPGKCPCRQLATLADPFGGGRQSRSDTLVQAPDLQRRERPSRVALDVELDRAAADFAILHVARLVRGQIDARLQALAAIRATHGHELLGRHARRSPARLPDRLQAIEPIDAVRVEARDPPAQALEFGGLASLHRALARSIIAPGRGELRCCTQPPTEDTTLCRSSVPAECCCCAPPPPRPWPAAQGADCRRMRRRASTWQAPRSA